MSFLYPFFNFLQPGILWPELTSLRPMLVLSALALLLGLGGRSSYDRREAWRSKQFFWLVLFIIAQALSVHRSGVGEILAELGYWYVFLLFVVISVLLMRDEKALHRYVWGTILGSLFVVGFGIYAVPAWGGYQGTGRAGAYGMYDNHNDYTFIIIQIVPYLYLFWRREKGFLRKTVLLLGLGACMIGVAMSMSRGGMITLVVEVALIVILGMEGRRRLWLLPLIGILGVGAVGYQYARRAANQGNGYTAEDAEQGRLELWKAGGLMLAANPLLGVGSRRFPEYAWQYYDLSHDMRGKVSHNTYVEVAATSGLVGFVSFMMMGWRLVQDLRRARRPGSTSGILDATRLATLIGVYAMALRALLDAKPHDWCFYSFCAIGIACCRMLDRSGQTADDGATEPADAVATSRSRVGPPSPYSSARPVALRAKRPPTLT
jgi:O-antigen ligase